MVPDLLVVGHITWDVTPNGLEPGGSAAYSALTAQKLGLEPALLTSHSSDLDLSVVLPGIETHTIPAADTTTFRNTYHKGVRTQFVDQVANIIQPSDLPDRFSTAPLVILGPVAGEIEDGLSGMFPCSIVLVSLQGWLRRINRNGIVEAVPWKGDTILPYSNIAIVSEEDINDKEFLDMWSSMTPLLILTEGSAGSMIHQNGEWSKIRAYEAREEIDPTGAGDVYATSYLIRYSETANPFESGKFASCAASFVIEAEGVKGIPTRTQVENRLEEQSSL